MISAHEAPKPSLASELLGSPKQDLRLRVQSPQQPPRILRVRTTKCTVGSATGCAVRVPEPRVAPVQCMLLRGARGNFVRWLGQDADSRHAFADSALKLGDRLQVGSVELHVLGPQTSASSRSGIGGEDGFADAVAKSAVEAIESRMQRLEKQLSQLHGQSAQNASPDLRKTVERLNGELDDERERHRGERELLRAERQRLTREVDEQTKQLVSLQEQIVESQSFAERCRQDGDGRVEALRTEIQQLAQLREDDARQHEDSRALWRAAKAEFEAELSANTVRLEQLERQLEDSQQQQTADAARREEFESQIKDLTDSLTRVSEQLAVEREEFENQHTEWSERRQELETKLADIETELAGAKAELTHSEQFSADLNTHAAEQEQWEQERQALSRQLSDVEQTRLRQESDAAQLNTRCTEFQTRIRELERQIENLRLAAESESLGERPSAEELEDTEARHQREREEWLAERKWFEEELDAQKRLVEQQQDEVNAIEQTSFEESQQWDEERRKIAQKLDQFQRRPQASAVPGLRPAEDQARGESIKEVEAQPGQQPPAAAPQGDSLSEDARPLAADPTGPDHIGLEPAEVADAADKDPAETPEELPDSVSFRESSAAPPVSTAEVLARLGQQGSWQDEEEEKAQARSPLAANPIQPRQTVLPSTSRQNEPSPATGSGDDDETIEDYMNRLLARVRGNDEPTPVASPEENVERRPITEATW